jgi:hypothetical protein
VLGLGHSDNQASLMYPFDMNASTIDGETQLALRTLYLAGWGGKVTLTDRATSDRPAMATQSIVSFTGSTHTLHMAWKGSRDDQGIYESELINNVWTPQRRILGRATSHSPAIASFPLNDGTSSTGLIMVWKGGDDEGMYFATKRTGGDWSAQQNIPGFSTADRPTLAFFNGAMHLAWRGPEGDQGLKWSTLGPDGWSPQKRFVVMASSTGPALVAFRNRLYMFWKGVEDDNHMYYTWIEDRPGSVWQEQRMVGFLEVRAERSERIPVETTRGPSATVRNDRILLAWKGGEGDTGIYISLCEGDDFSGQVRIEGVGTSQGPCVYGTDGWTQFAWKGVEGENVLHWSAWGL